MARVGTVEVDFSTGAGIKTYRASKGVQRDVKIIEALSEHDLLPNSKALRNRLQRILETDQAFKRLDDAHRKAKERLNDRELQREVATKTMLGFVDHIKNGEGDPGDFDFTQFAPDIPDVEGLRVRRNIAKRARAGALNEFFGELREYGYDRWFDKQLKPVLDKKIEYAEDDTWQYATIKKKRRERDKLEPVLRRVNLAVAKKTILKGVHLQTPGIEKTLTEDIWDAREAMDHHVYDKDRFEHRNEKGERVATHSLKLNEVMGG